MIFCHVTWFARNESSGCVFVLISLNMFTNINSYGFCDVKCVFVSSYLQHLSLTRMCWNDEFQSPANARVRSCSQRQFRESKMYYRISQNICVELSYCEEKKDDYSLNGTRQTPLHLTESRHVFWIQNGEFRQQVRRLRIPVDVLSWLKLS